MNFRRADDRRQKNLRRPRHTHNCVCDEVQLFHTPRLFRRHKNFCGGAKVFHNNRPRRQRHGDFCGDAKAFHNNHPLRRQRHGVFYDGAKLFHDILRRLPNQNRFLRRHKHFQILRGDRNLPQNLRHNLQYAYRAFSANFFCQRRLAPKQIEQQIQSPTELHIRLQTVRLLIRA